MINGVTIPSHISAETVDGETIVINFLTGAYYTLDGAAAKVWQQISTAGLESAGELDRGVVADFAAAGIVIADPSLSLPNPSADPAKNGFKAYTDMAQILLADPIHEVGQQGWPILRADNDQPARD